MRLTPTVMINGRAYKPQYFRSRISMMIDKFWLGLLVIHLCLTVASADVVTVTVLLLTFVANVSCYILYLGRD